MTPLKKLLLGTTSLSIWNVAPRDPITIGSAILSAFAIETTSVALIYAVGYLATTAVTSWALKALYPKPSAASMSSQGLLANAKDAAAAHEYVYGTVRKGGVITYLESTGASNKFLHIILTLAGHEVNAIGDIYIDDQVATLDGSGYVTSGTYNKGETLSVNLAINVVAGAASVVLDSTPASLGRRFTPVLPL